MGYIDLIISEASLFSLGGAISGLAIHHGLFIHGEWHNQAPDILRYYAGVFGCIAVSHFFSPSDLVSRISSGLALASVFHVVSLILSILVYRGCFHRLNSANFPGPRWARFTKIWQIYENRQSKNHIYLHSLHEKYGDVVRTGKV